MDEARRSVPGSSGFIFDVIIFGSSCRISQAWHVRVNTMFKYVTLQNGETRQNKAGHAANKHTKRPRRTVLLPGIRHARVYGLSHNGQTLSDSHSRFAISKERILLIGHGLCDRDVHVVPARCHQLAMNSVSPRQYKQRYHDASVSYSSSRAINS